MKKIYLFVVMFFCYVMFRALKIKCLLYKTIFFSILLGGMKKHNKRIISFESNLIKYSKNQLILFPIKIYDRNNTQGVDYL